MPQPAFQTSGAISIFSAFVLLPTKSDWLPDVLLVKNNDGGKS